MLHHSVVVYPPTPTYFGYMTEITQSPTRSIKKKVKGIFAHFQCRSSGCGLRSFGIDTWSEDKLCLRFIRKCFILASKILTMFGGGDNDDEFDVIDGWRAISIADYEVQCIICVFDDVYFIMYMIQYEII